MKNDNLTDPSTDINAINEKVTAAIRSHQFTIRALTTFAFITGFLSLAASLFLAWGFLIWILPKQTELEQDRMVFVSPAQTNTVAPLTPQESIARINQFLVVEASVSRAVGIGTAVLAASVGTLGLGTLLLLLVVLLSRRASLNQIKATLAQISDQLRDLRASPPHP